MATRFVHGYAAGLISVLLCPQASLQDRRERRLGESAADEAQWLAGAVHIDGLHRDRGVCAGRGGLRRDKRCPDRLTGESGRGSLRLLEGERLLV